MIRLGCGKGEFMWKLIEDRHLVVESGKSAKYINRTLKERFFEKLYGKYYVPFRKEKLVVVVNYKPDKSLYKMGDIIIGHPEILIRLKAALLKENRR